MEQIGSNLTVFGRDLIDEKTIEQIKRCIGPDDIGVLTADAHYGYGHPIGGAVAYKNHVSVSGVGFDIACGNKAVKTNIKTADIDRAAIMDEIMKRVSFGVGQKGKTAFDHPVLEKIRAAEVSQQRNLLDLAATQLGTIGSGNHFVDLFTDDQGFLWIGNHFGSRGFGHKTATGFMALAQGLSFTDSPKQGSMDSPPILLRLDSDLGQAYLEGMQLAGAYAYAGRDIVVDIVRDILGDSEPPQFEVHNHHNFAWMEDHFGERYCVVRKGCTPAAPGQFGFIGANMRDTSFIVQGKRTQTNAIGLNSTVHGAGRVLSRTQAAGKKKWIRNENGHKRPTVVTPGCVDFKAVQAQMKSFNVELRGAGADEAPECYKSLIDVLGAHEESVEIIGALYPIGVAMAGDEFDPYKD